MRYLGKVVLLAGAYCAVGSLGQSLAIPPGNVTLVWPPSGIALAALLLGGDRLWPGIWLGAILVNVRTLFDPELSPSLAASLIAAAAIATGSTVQALVGRRGIAHLAGGPSFLDRARGVFRFTAVAMLMCLIGSTIGATSLALAGFIPRDAHGFVWRTWWLGDLAGVLAFTPPLVVWTRRRPARWAPGGLAEAAALVGLLAATTLVVFGGWLPAGTSAAYLTFPILMWAAFRFGQRGATAALVFVAGMASWGTGTGAGPFQGGALQMSLLLLQLFVSVITLSTLSLAAVVEERRRAAGALDELNRTLEQQVAERSAAAEQRAGRLARSEAACREQARTFRSVLDNILEGIVVADAWGEIVLWNPAAERLIGSGPLDVGPDQWSSRYGCFLPDRVTPYPVDRLPLMRVLRGEVVRGEEMFLRNPSRPDGIWLRITGVPLRHEGGEAVGGVVVLRDDTDRKQAEIRMQSVIESVLTGIVVVDEGGRITQVNRQTELLFGYARDELCGQPVEVLMPEHLRQTHRRHFEGYLGDPQSRAMGAMQNIRGRRKDGRTIDLQVALSPFRQDGELFILASVLDITEQKRASDLVQSVRGRAEEELRASEGRFRQLAETMPQIVWTSGADGTFTYFNDRWYQYTGLAPEDSLVRDGLPMATHPEDLEQFTSLRAQALGAGEVYESEVRLRHCSGAYRWHLVRSVPVRDEAGQVVRRFGTATDIDDHRRTEEALRASERQYRAVYDQADIGIAEVDLTGRFLRANDRYCEIVGYPREELLRLRFQDITPPDDPPAHLEQFARIAEGPSNYTIEKRYVRKDGRVVWARTAVSLIRDGAGRPERVAGVVEDITEGVRAEEALRQSEARFRAISEAAPLGIFLTDPAGDCLYTNRAYLELAGRGAEEALGKGWREIIHPEDRESVFAEWYRAAGDRLPFELSYRFLHRDGRTIWVSTRSAEIRVGDALAGYVGVVEDITQKRQAIEALRRSEERFDLAVRGTDAGIWDWDLRTDTIYFSPRWKSMLGYAEGEIGNGFTEWESRLHPEDRERAGKAVQDYLEGRSAEYELEHRLRHKDGSYRWILARGAAVRDDDGRPYRMVGSHIDVSVHKQTVDQLNENLVQLRAAQRIQQAMLPKQSPDLTGLDIAGISYPAAYAGGDMFDYLPMLGGNLGIVVGDVAGHGIGAALQMASTLAFVRSLAQTCATVGEVMARVNRFVFEETLGDSFVTLMLIRLDPRTRSLTYANAGHPPGYVLDPSGEVRAELSSSVFPLGLEEHQDFPVAEPVVLRPGELVVLVTDGILEPRSPEGAFFGRERMLDVVRAARDRASHEIVEELHRAVGRHTGTAVFEDDVTAVVIKVGRGGP